MNNNPLKVPCIILSCISLVSVAAVGVLAVSNAELKENTNAAPVYVPVYETTAETAAETEAAAMTEPPAETEAPETEFAPPVTDENTVYMYDDGITLLEYPAIEGVTMNDFDMSLLETDDRKHKALFDKEGNKRTRFGIDVSSYQMNIDWNAVAADDVEFAFIRIGYRGYETGQLCEDKYFRRNIEGATAAGIDRGVYFFSQAITPEEAKEEAEYVISILNDCNAELTLPIVFDWEFPTDEDPARTDDLDGDTQTECCIAFCEAVKAAGYEPMYYSTINTAVFRYDMSRLTDYPIWIAEYTPEAHFVYDYKMWQYSCSGVVSGIEGFVDLNIMINE